MPYWARTRAKTALIPRAGEACKDAAPLPSPLPATYKPAMATSFVKMHGAGNDFVVFDERAAPLGLSSGRTAALADRQRGIGCDQIISLELPPDGADVALRIRNADGSESGACGNATRCVALLLAAENGRRRQIIHTAAGELVAEILGPRLVRVDMGRPRFAWQEIPLSAPADTLNLPIARGPLAKPAACSMGNPHATFFVAGLNTLPLTAFGPGLERHQLFPEHANIGFAEILAPARIRLKVWERGAGLTRACGTGACAALVNAHRRGLIGRAATVVLDGGELEIAWREDDHVLMTGPAAIAFRGEVALEDYPP